jgi:hypothetical protein
MRGEKSFVTGNGADQVNWRLKMPLCVPPLT